MFKRAEHKSREKGEHQDESIERCTKCQQGTTQSKRISFAIDCLHQIKKKKARSYLDVICIPLEPLISHSVCMWLYIFTRHLRFFLSSFGFCAGLPSEAAGKICHLRRWGVHFLIHSQFFFLNIYLYPHRVVCIGIYTYNIIAARFSFHFFFFLVASSFAFLLFGCVCLKKKILTFFWVSFII